MPTCPHGLLIATFVSVAAVACSEDETNPGCPEQLWQPCDVRGQACRKDLFRHVDCVDDGKVSAREPGVDFVMRDAYADQVLADAGAAPELPRTDELERAYEMLGLLEPMDLQPIALAERRLRHLAASYSVGDGRVMVLVDDTSTPLTEPSLHFALAHEYAHAIQDQEHDLKAFFEARQGSYDEILGARTLCEGEAQVRAALTLYGDVDVVDRAFAAFAALVPDASQSALDEPAPLLEASYHFPYDHGARYVEHERSAGGRSAVDRLFADPPTGSGPILEAVEGAGPAGPGSAPSPDPARLPAGYELLTDDSLGAIVLHGFVARQLADLELGRAAALDWSADRIFLYRGGSGNAALWRVGWKRPRALCGALAEAGWSDAGAICACRDESNATTVLACSDDAGAADTLLNLAFPAP